jgi:hypothetical protein
MAKTPSKKTAKVAKAAGASKKKAARKSRTESYSTYIYKVRAQRWDGPLRGPTMRPHRRHACSPPPPRYPCSVPLLANAGAEAGAPA